MKSITIVTDHGWGYWERVGEDWYLTPAHGSRRKLKVEEDENFDFVVRTSRPKFVLEDYLANYSRVSIDPRAIKILEDK